jgi:homospermidine synthase
MDISQIKKISLHQKLMFLGYGAVAKCTWNYFSSYFNIQHSNVYLVDRLTSAFYGPNIKYVHKITKHVSATNIESLLDFLEFREGDIIIDLTFASSTYFFIHTCLTHGIHYLNTSIEDDSDMFTAGSIDYQQQMIKKIVHEFSSRQPIKSCVVTEFGQNPGLIQHYVLYALRQLYQLKNPSKTPSHDDLRSMVDEYKIGSILLSERDLLRTTRELKKDTLYNTWSVAGFIGESLDCAEVVKGTNNPYVKPLFKPGQIHDGLAKLYQPYQYGGKEVFFLKENGRFSTLPTIAPIVVNDDTGHGHITYESFYGSLIHHGETFELANYFGKNAPFMSYVYQYNPYLDQSMDQIEKEYELYDKSEWMSYILSKPDSFCVFDNINTEKQDNMKGCDSIGCTLLCGDRDIERIFWCGTIVTDRDTDLFTPTTVQVAAGVLSSLSYIMEPGRKPGYYSPCELDTTYVLEKAKPLLGTFFFTEIPKTQFNEPFECRLRRQ